MKRWMALFLLPLFALGCRFRDLNVLPDAPGQYQVIGLKFNFKTRNERQSGKIFWKLRDDHSALVVLSPINQPLAEAFTTGEEITLVNKKKQRYWRGYFREFLDFYWQLELSLEETKALLWEGRIPANMENGLKIKLEHAEEGGPVKKIVISRFPDTLSISINKRETRKGDFSHDPIVGRMAAASLEDIFKE